MGSKPHFFKALAFWFSKFWFGSICKLHNFLINWDLVLAGNSNVVEITKESFPFKFCLPLNTFRYFNHEGNRRSSKMYSVELMWKYEFLYYVGWYLCFCNWQYTCTFYPLWPTFNWAQNLIISMLYFLCTNDPYLYIVY